MLREIERLVIRDEVLEQIGSGAAAAEIYDALVARGYWNKDEREGLILVVDWGTFEFDSPFAVKHEV